MTRDPSELPDVRRLLGVVETMPWRYAPFYARLGTLWDLSEAEVISVLTRAGEPATWKKAALPGVRLVEIAPGPRLAGASATLAHFRPGLVFPRHRHVGPEALLVLEGSYVDESGRVVGPGDLHEMPAASEHGVRVNRAEPCVLASVQFGLHFTGPLMRVLARLFAG